MESPQMYDSPQQQAISQMDIKKMATNNSNGASANGSTNGNANNLNSNNSAAALNHNGLIVNKQQGQLHLQQATNNNNNNTNNNNNNNVLLQKQILQHYSTQSDLEELTSQEISLDLQHLIDDQFRDQETLQIFSELVPNTNNNNNNNNTNNNNSSGNHANANQNGSVAAAAKVLQLQQQQRMNQQSYPRGALAYMPQAVHTGATYTNNSSDENSSIGSDAANIKEVSFSDFHFKHMFSSVIFLFEICWSSIIAML